MAPGFLRSPSCGDLSGDPLRAVGDHGEKYSPGDLMNRNLPGGVSDEDLSSYLDGGLEPLRRAQGAPAVLAAAAAAGHADRRRAAGRRGARLAAADQSAAARRQPARALH